MERFIVGVMGPSEGATVDDLSNAHELGRLIAKQGWILLCGGRNVGIMDAVCTGAREVGGITVGVLPGTDKQGMSSAVDIPIVTGMGNARNNINVLSSDVVIACGMARGTASEVALAVKAEKPVILLDPSEETEGFFVNLSPEFVQIAKTPFEVIELVQVLKGY